MCLLDKRYIQKGIKGGPARIVEKTHPDKQANTKVTTTYTSQVLSNKSNTYSLNMNHGESESLIRCFHCVTGGPMCVVLRQDRNEKRMTVKFRV